MARSARSASPNDTRGAVKRRQESDSLGTVDVPADALYGAQTARAAAWSFSGQRFPLAVIHAIARIKAAAAVVHGAAGRLPAPIATAIERAALEAAGGEHDEQFVVDLFQTGSGTSSHMNVNEVVASRATALLGEDGTRVSAYDHVNLGQSSNDVVPSAIRLAAVAAAEQELLPALDRLAGTLHELADRHWGDVRNGRTHLMAAMPIRFGQQFRGQATRVEACRRQIVAIVESCRALPLGGTAVGTGVTCPPGFAAAVCTELTARHGVRVRETTGHLASQNSLGPLAFLGGDLRNTAMALYKIVNDVRWQASDALREIELPAMQAGSSIMVGKVNPVVCEAAAMAFAQVLGNDAVLAFAESQGQFELNTMFPLAARNVLESIDLVARAAEAFRAHALLGLKVRPDTAAAAAANPVLATALAQALGHEPATAIAMAAAAQGAPVLAIAREQTTLPLEQLQQMLDVGRLCGEIGKGRVADGDDAPPPPDPRVVVEDDTLPLDAKIAKLQRWREDERALDRANDEGMQGAVRPGNVDAIDGALRELGADGTS